MGKKGKDKKKSKGAEKTAAKTDKKLSNKQKKELAALGEDDIEQILAEIENEDKRRQKIIETTVQPPSRRVNFSFISHPDKDELILFGGEFFDGQKTFVYNDLFVYNISQNQWTVVKVPGGPPPRCAHQMVATSAGKGQLWLFGGEFASPTQSQFYHYRDLWVYHVSLKKWEKISATGGPSARSGHRMVHNKKQLFVFGGYHDNLREYKYFNDVYVFNLENYTWVKLEPSGMAPAPRSGCNMVALPDGRVLIFGGYSKERIKKDVDKGRVYNDMYILTPEKNDSTGTKFRWVSAKHIPMSLRCSMSLTAAPNNKAYIFGGVFDVEDDEENLTSKFFNELYCFDLEKLSWRLITLNKKSKPSKTVGNEQDMDVEEQQQTTVSNDGIFTVTVGPAASSSAIKAQEGSFDEKQEYFQPSPRMNCGLAVKHGILYLYGGLVEIGCKQITLADFYSLDLRKLEEWKTIIKDDTENQEWLGSESESEESESDSEEEEENSDDTDMEVD